MPSNANAGVVRLIGRMIGKSWRGYGRDPNTDTMVLGFSAALLLSLAWHHSQAMAEPAPTTSGTVGDLDEVVVTGQVMPGSVIGDIPPENQLSPVDIAAYGVSSVNDLLEQISQLTQSDQGRGNTAPIVLINGKRVSGVNEIGDFPTESIRRLDILPEEVALKYGYGAQQKVVNIILRRHFLAKVIDGNVAKSTEGGGDSSTLDESYTRIRDNDRTNIVGRIQSTQAITESDRGVSSTAANVTDPTGLIGNDSQFRSLLPQSTIYSINGVIAHPLTERITESLNLTASYQLIHALLGFPSAILDVPADSPFARSASDSTIDRFLNNQVIHQDTTVGTAHLASTSNVDLPKKWTLSVIASLDFSSNGASTDGHYNLSPLQAQVSAGTINPYGTFSAVNLGPDTRVDTTARTYAASTSTLLNGTIFHLPAGGVLASLALSADVNALSSSGALMTATSSMRRSDLGTQLSLDFPLTSVSYAVLEKVGDVTGNLTVGVTQVSDYGAISAIGYGIHWQPTSNLSVLATLGEDRLVPTLTQLDSPTITTPNARVYDYVSGQTVTVNEITGGNPSLRADDRHILKLSVTDSIINQASLKLNATANYFDSRIRDPFISLSTATAATEATFPSLFERSAFGDLEDVDERAVNIAEANRRSVRWGMTLTKVLRAPTRPTRAAQNMNGRWRSTGDGANSTNSAGDTPTPKVASQDPSITTAPAPATNGQWPATQATSTPDNGLGEVVVSGDRTDNDNAPRRSEFSYGRRFQGGMGSGGFGPGGNGRGGRPEGFGPGGNGQNRGGYGGGNGAQLDISLYHSWYFKDDVLLKAGSPAINLLDGGSIGAGGQARHKVQLNAGVIDNGIGVRVSGSWTSATEVFDSGNGAGSLAYSSIATLDFRTFINLQQRFLGQSWANGARITFSVKNIFNAHQKVLDSEGNEPAIYQPAILDPVGRQIGVAFRKMF